ncbi:protein-ribulosamine 3-kinase-like protein [Triangularia verruculosa]|uniref:protein-ribulosamine 3-kinase n=1 Tax=Triangularia verruculosa TaxID=2587418 RepID=A0AAN6XEX5_9PEZI|nr:protein-ribulosamine 3-kinase-like protein [Triangularia verruculosa]
MAATNLLFEEPFDRVDPAVEAAIRLLPENYHGPYKTTNHGTSNWGTTGRVDAIITAENHDKPRIMSFFIKTASGSTGLSMLTAEFQSVKTIHAILPDFTPLPIATGTFASDTSTHFLLSEFHDFIPGRLTDPIEFSLRLARLHMDSKSPTGKFGFHVQTYAGNLPQFSEWESSWEKFFAKSLRQALDLEIAVKGPNLEVGALSLIIFQQVIPRLLGPLERDGRTVKPSLVHGDLWFGNAGVDSKREKSMIFDAACFYAHNEYEFGQWQPTCNKFDQRYLDAYHKVVPKSEPVEDYGGRLELYKLRFNTHVSALFPTNTGLREQVIGDMKMLVERYA